jgi:vanillate O-demethylase ferredoxin subunit
MTIELPSVTDGDTLRVFVRQIRYEGRGIHSYELVDEDGGELPAFEAGAHIDVHLPGGTVRQYSLANDPGERHRYVIAVLKDEGGRGGSKSLHDTLRVQDTVLVSRPRNNFALVDDAQKVVLLAGGIGVTPLKAMAHSLDRLGLDYELHYCAKEPQNAAFNDELRALAEKGRVHFHFDGGDPAKGLDLAALLRDPADATHVYYCGPAGFMNACADATTHWPKGTVHFEHFKPPAAKPDADALPPGAFIAELARSGRRIEVAADTSLADALNDAGIEVPTSCTSGLCGTCKVRYLGGEVDHQDYILGDDEHAEYLTACVSRAKGGLLVLDL